MALNVQTAPQTRPYDGKPIINDFTIMAATKNGTGSQTSNNVLVMSLFRMGIPVNGKNLFPSNIKGLPTWYSIRASKDGFVARPAHNDVAIVMNPETADEDIQKLPAGGVCIIPQGSTAARRDDVIFYDIPVDALVKEAGINADLRERVANMVYVGAVAQLFEIPLDVIWQVLLDNFNGKEKPAKINYDMVTRAFEWTKANITKQDPYKYAPIPGGNAGKIVITGNEAGGLGALFGGVQVVAWYPITPSTSLVDAMFENQGIRKDPETGKNTIAIMQAEDEIAAIGAIIGAGWAGARSMTSTSGPGISLMGEFAGLAYFAEIPCVVWDVTRIGPSTGLPTRTGQGDLMQLYTLSHGDTHHIVLIPGTVGEAFEFGWRAQDIAEQFQTIIFVMSDLDLGMNNWMSDPFEYPTEPLNRGKTLDLEGLTAFLSEKGEWYRYKDYDGDGIPYRTIPGIDHPKAAYFTRGTGHTERATYSERSEDWVANLSRVKRKINNARTQLPQPVVATEAGATIGILSYGTNDPAIVEARAMLATKGVKTDYMRVRALPLSPDVHAFIHSHERVFLLENNFDAQMAQIIRGETDRDTSHMKVCALGDSLPMTAQWVFDHIMESEGK
jgi:2-oxoglutarate ferredoxin oxidoreductase subunit alpha